MKLIRRKKDGRYVANIKSIRAFLPLQKKQTNVPDHPVRDEK